jgi:hypothetical protein
MGSWGAGPLQNDQALDFASRFLDGGWTEATESLDKVPGDGTAEIWQFQLGLSVAAVAALGLGASGIEGVVDEVGQGIAAHGEPPATVVERSIALVDLAAQPGTELYDDFAGRPEWAGPPTLDDWLAELASLRRQLEGER